MNLRGFHRFGVPARAAALAAALAGAGCRSLPPAASTSPDAAGREWDWGPFASRLTDARGVVRTRAAGPIFERARDPATGRTLTAARPLYARAEDPVSGWTHWDSVWPLAEGKSFKNQMSWRVATVWYQDFDTSDSRSRWRLWALPFYFQGRDAQGRAYAAVFPLGGRIREFFLLDRVDFALWPLWVQSRQGEIRSNTVLWPIFSETKGKGIYRARVFPLYGRSAMRDHYVKKFVLWPIFTSARYEYPQSRGYGFVLLPFYGRINLTDQDSHLVLPPFFRHTRGARQNLVLAPWPFVQIGWGEQRRFYLWPLYGRLRRPGVASEFALWPLFWRERIDRPGAILRRWKFLPFVSLETETLRRPPPGAPAVRRRYTQIWPLGSYERSGGERRWRGFELLPFRAPPPVERSWAPWWTVFERTIVGDRTDTELLWGVYRRQTRGDRFARTSIFPFFEWRGDRADPAAPARAWSLLKGFLGVETRNGETRLRVLYFLRFTVRREPTP